METLKTMLNTLLTHMGTIALVGLVAYVLYCEFIRPAPSRAELADALRATENAQHDLTSARADLKLATDLVRDVHAGNVAAIGQVKDLVAEMKAHTDSLNEREKTLDGRAKRLEAGYRAKIVQLQEAKKKAL